MDVQTAETEVLNENSGQLRLDRPRIQNAVPQLTAQNERWINLLSQDDLKQREREEKQYRKFTEGEDNFLFTLDRGHEALATIGVLIEEVTKEIQRRQTRENPNAYAAPLVPHAYKPLAHLPKITIKPFYGNIT